MSVVVNDDLGHDIVLSHIPYRPCDAVKHRDKSGKTQDQNKREQNPVFFVPFPTGRTFGGGKFIDEESRKEG